MCTAYGDDDFEVVYQLVSHDSPNWEHWRIEIIEIDHASPLDFGDDG